MSMLQSLRPLQNSSDYEAALSEVKPYFKDEPAPASLEAAHFDALVVLIEDYEARHYPQLPSAS